VADRRTPQVTGIAPQFLVDDLDRAIAYYRDRLGFELDFTYQSFYAGVSRDGVAIHLKHAPKVLADRAHRRQNEHLDAYISVTGIRGLFSELQTRGAEVIKPLEARPWAFVDFYVQDPDGYILCFSEPEQRAETPPVA
jgi:catechol 2,3-dioxygenase-like lactoylglutathione lyase family enzyme